MYSIKIISCTALCTSANCDLLFFSSGLQDNINTVQNGFDTGRSVAINVTNMLTCLTNSGIRQVTCVLVVM